MTVNLYELIKKIADVTKTPAFDKIKNIIQFI